MNLHDLIPFAAAAVIATIVWFLSRTPCEVEAIVSANASTPSTLLPSQPLPIAAPAEGISFETVVAICVLAEIARSEGT